MTYPAMLAFVLLIGYALLLRRRCGRRLRVDVEIPCREKHTLDFPELNRLVAQAVSSARLHRVEVDEKSMHASFFVECRGDSQLLAMIDCLRRSFPSAAVSLSDPAHSASRFNSRPLLAGHALVWRLQPPSRPR